MNYHCLANKRKGTQPATNVEQDNTAEAVTISYRKKSYPTENPVAQTMQNGATTKVKIRSIIR